MTEEKSKEPSFVVKDKRRFDADGNAKSDGVVEERAQPKVASKGLEGADMSHTDDSPREGSDEISFGSFVISLATQALMMMGEIKPPEGVPISKDLTGAKNTIDVLNLLQDKTKGNLDAQEDRLLQEVLHNLRMTFLRAR